MYRTTPLLLLWLLPLVSCHAIQTKHEKEEESPENDTTERMQQAFHTAVANVYRTSRKSRSNQATFVESKFPLLDHGRQTLSKDCSNALLELKQDNFALQQASLDLSDEVEQAVSLCDSNADICQVDENTLPSSRDFVQACVQDAGGAIWEYHVQITCTLLQTNNGIIDIVDTVVFQYLNSDECADPTHCNRNDLGQAAEREADILLQGVEQQLELLFALMTNTGTQSPYSVECDSRVTDNDQPLANPASLRTTSSATQTLLPAATREGWRFLGLLPIMLVGILGWY